MQQQDACTEMPELEAAKKCKVDGSVKQSEKEAKMMQLAEICGVLKYVEWSDYFPTGARTLPADRLKHVGRAGAGSGTEPPKH